MLGANPVGVLLSKTVLQAGPSTSLAAFARALSLSQDSCGTTFSSIYLLPVTSGRGGDRMGKRKGADETGAGPARQRTEAQGFSKVWKRAPLASALSERVMSKLKKKLGVRGELSPNRSNMNFFFGLADPAFLFCLSSSAALRTSLHEET